ncbi:TetR/AcrR family transcriptional regulator [Kineosporia babensis]|uniref:TetR/AcrR family transcriptional regulator n=1 Tax=Kineosporia babensis TaxID=499548 RepID=A0A9X1NEJ5_9ACTN|nr:TetR/AcrR family transcriptional regulator [Kineosporia babensis]MCD5312375.1 TetR/AcrR family transcriptional regulator [Kineosporia babensis]
MSTPRRARPGLTPDTVVAAGRTLIEREGLEALSMRAVAAELNTAATSLYRHVADRDALLIALLEQVAAGLPVEVPGRTPRRRLLNRLVGAHDHMSRHSWVMQILIRGELVAEGAYAFSNACLTDFMDAGLSARRAVTAYGACWHLTVGELLERHPHLPPQQPTQRTRVLQEADAERLPAVAEVRALNLTPPVEDYQAEIEALLKAFIP